LHCKFDVVDKPSVLDACPLHDVHGYQRNADCCKIYRLLSATGCQDILDDYTWANGMPLLSSYSLALLANPRLQFIDVSSTQLSSNGLFFFLLEVANCNPVRDASGLLTLRQLRCGPPALTSEDAGSARWLASLSDAVGEVFRNCPALELVSLVVHQYSAAGQEHMSDGMDELSTRWLALDDKNGCDHVAVAGQAEMVMRTECVTL
jgi:hypothetical protein